ncbi:uncharacterized protein An12g02150 [Aspergillus niger]|uniref:Contig An12c0060, genomic contig n=2 Tax=Aspergillus niger TaxID=5061 RepID=A2QYR1_ASPNC|nr:uncharacterized protein An12g02150 [Aspergillus niger]CAK48496.1 unnamed protein product [Aspergillus niger]
MPFCRSTTTTWCLGSADAYCQFFFFFFFFYLYTSSNISFFSPNIFIDPFDAYRFHCVFLLLSFLSSQRWQTGWIPLDASLSDYRAANKETWAPICLLPPAYRAELGLQVIRSGTFKKIDYKQGGPY